MAEDQTEDVPPPPKLRKQRPKKYDTTREYNLRYYHDVIKKNRIPKYACIAMQRWYAGAAC